VKYNQEEVITLKRKPTVGDAIVVLVEGVAQMKKDLQESNVRAKQNYERRLAARNAKRKS
jgi:hypothetical protein